MKSKANKFCEGSAMFYGAENWAMSVEDANRILVEDANRILVEDANRIVVEDANRIVVEDANRILVEDAYRILVEDANRIVVEDANTDGNTYNEIVPTREKILKKQIRSVPKR